MEELTLSRPGENLVIVVDDDFRIREALESLLASAGIRVVTFNSAEEVLRSRLLSQAACLITDVRMSTMSGLELWHLLQREYPKLPAIIITGHHDEQIRESALSSGAAAFFYKPIDPDNLLWALQAAIDASEKDVSGTSE